MRRPRLKAPASHPVAYYHCVSRVVNREFVRKRSTGGHYPSAHR